MTKKKRKKVYQLAFNKIYKQHDVPMAAKEMDSKYPGPMPF